MEIHRQPSVLLILPLLLRRPVAEDVWHVEIQMGRVEEVGGEVVVDRGREVEGVEREFGFGFFGALDEGEMVGAVVEDGVEVGAVADEGAGGTHEGGDDENQGGRGLLKAESG